ncbi:cuticle protein 7 [Musca domestica]|uniref:Cuticle protein 7 n=2 Tax=Musca domestica TaxID=7370 RepID=A0A9J7I8H4_MUSDO|nr:cuticle protein 7 [Musca domestica]
MKVTMKILTSLAFVLLVMARSGMCLAPYYMEYYANYHDFHNDDKLNYKYHYYIDHAPSKVHMMHMEERHGDKVTGQYGLLEPNGMVRSVHYQVVGDNGFESVVRTRTPHSSSHIRLMSHKQPLQPILLQQPVASVI